LRIRRLAARAWLALSLASGLFACGGDTPVSPPSPSPTPPPPPRVAILSVDGLRPDAIAKADTPNLHSLIAKGSHTLQARTIDLSNTLPSHTSMLTAYPLSIHKVSWDDYQPSRRIAAPTIFTAIKARNMRSVMVVGKEKFQQFRDMGDADVFALTLQGDDEVANQAIVQMGISFDLMFVHFPDVDMTGHAKGWMSAAYLEKVAVADRAIGRVLAALPAGVTVIVTADHGGHGTGHGTTAPEDVTIPWIISGPGVRQGFTLTTPVVTLDTTATAGRVLGLALPSDVSGRAVAAAFQ
jgi:predicted AlkP superfamily pyrophosphatase or phosphodiesterase